MRTFCTPDPVIKKQLKDGYKVLEMLGAPLVTFLAFQEIQVKVLGIIKDEQEKKDQYAHVKHGIEKRWEPPSMTYKDVKELERMNPFT